MEIEIGPCKTKAGFFAKPKKPLKLDLEKIKTAFQVKMDTPIALVITCDNEEIIVHSYGELIFKTLKDREKIRKIAERIYAA